MCVRNCVLGGQVALGPPGAGIGMCANARDGGWACLHRLRLLPAAAGLQLHLAQLAQREEPEGAAIAHSAA